MNKVILYISRGIIVQSLSRATQQVTTALSDPNATFISDGVRVGDAIVNINELGEIFEAIITEVQSETYLLLSNNIYGQGDQEANYTINGALEQVDLFEDETISLTSKIQDVRDISKVFTDFSQSFTLPASKRNNKIFKHFYNYFISEGAFDARKKINAKIEINYIPFRDGKVFLNGVKMKNNKPYAYNITFFGNTVSLKDLMGDDELSELPYLDQWTHSYNANNVKTGLTTGISVSGAPNADASDIIYPPISAETRWYYSSASVNSSTIQGNLSYLNSASHQDVGMLYTDLKPAIKVSRIIEAIESKYGVVFNGFFDTTPISNLYLWMSREKGRIGGTSGQDNTKVLGTWSQTSGDTIITISSDGTELRYNDDPLADRVRYRLTITPATGNESISYTVYTYLNDVLYSTDSGLTGTNTVEIDSDGFELYNTPVKYVVATTTSFSFTPTLQVDATDRSGGNLQTEYLTCGLLSSLSQIIITSQLPKIKVYDFFSGLLKMFNLIIYYEDDRADANYGRIIIKSLDDYYSDNPAIFDITQYVDSSETDIESTIPFSEIDFSYEEGKTLLMKQHKEAFNQDFGDEEFRPTGIDRGKPYKVKVPFEHLKYERLIDENTGSNTTIIWGYSAGDNFKPDADSQPHPTANYDSVLTKPVLFYGERRTSGLTSINWSSSTPHSELTSYWSALNTNEFGTSSVAPDYTLNFDNEIDEYTFTDYGGTSNSLFKVWYKTYIEDVFNAKKRIFKLTAHLPNSVLLKYNLNDRFQIGDKVFTINSIDTNLKTGESKLELLNVL